jgi:hypothetical protein
MKTYPDVSTSYCTYDLFEVWLDYALLLGGFSPKAEGFIACSTWNTSKSAV